MRAEIEDEIMVLRSVYGDECVEIEQYDEENDIVLVKLQVPFDNRESPILVKTGLSNASLTAVPSIVVKLQLSHLYPEESPTVSFEGLWITNRIHDWLFRGISEKLKENVGVQTLFFCYIWIQELVTKSDEFKEIDLEDAKDRQMDSEVLLKKVIEASGEVKQRIFDSSWFTCQVCFEEKRGADCVEFKPCDHVFCKDCTFAYYRNIMADEVRALSCMSENCLSLASHFTVREALGEEQAERYEEIILNHALSKFDDVVPCARDICQKPVVYDTIGCSGNRLLATCKVCLMSFCVRCRRTYHGVNPCRFNIESRDAVLEEYEKVKDNSESLKQFAMRFGGLVQLKRFIDTLRSEAWIIECSKPCPKCGAAIEKNEGCNKMHCTKCDTLFCWLCLKRLNKDDPYGHFNDGACANRLFEVPPDDDDDDELLQFPPAGYFDFLNMFDDVDAALEDVRDLVEAFRDLRFDPVNDGANDAVAERERIIHAFADYAEDMDGIDDADADDIDVEELFDPNNVDADDNDYYNDEDNEDDIILRVEGLRSNNTDGNAEEHEMEGGTSHS